jgi:hypothetical protein
MITVVYDIIHNCIIFYPLCLYFYSMTQRVLVNVVSCGRYEKKKHELNEYTLERTDKCLL